MSLYLIQYSDGTTRQTRLPYLYTLPEGPRFLIRDFFFSSMVRYKLKSSHGAVEVEEVDGINAFREFNSMRGMPNEVVNLVFQKQEECFIETIAHPYYNGIIAANDYMSDRFPEIWNLILLEMVQNKHMLFDDYVEKNVGNIEFRDPGGPLFIFDSVWYDAIRTIVDAHIRSAVGVIFERNLVTKDRKWLKDDGISSFAEYTSRDFWLEDENKDNIYHQERMYNTNGNNVQSFLDLVKINCKLIEEEAEDSCNNDSFGGILWEAAVSDSDSQAAVAKSDTVADSDTDSLAIVHYDEEETVIYW